MRVQSKIPTLKTERPTVREISVKLYDTENKDVESFQMGQKNKVTDTGITS